MANLSEYYGIGDVKDISMDRLALIMEDMYQKTALAINQNSGVCPAPGPYSITANGYVTLWGGLIVQWGIAPSVSPLTFRTFTWPIPFPSAVFSISATQLQPGLLTDSVNVMVATLTTTTIVTMNTHADVYVVAIGH